MLHRRFLIAILLLALPALSSAQYQPTIASLDTHPLPQWYAGAKLGIFIHYGLYSVPGWAPLSHPEHDFRNIDYIKNNPYAEWYLNVMRIPGSPTEAWHREHYGANFSYYDFAPIFNRGVARSGIPTNGPPSSTMPARNMSSSPASTTKASRSGPAPRPIPAPPCPTDRAHAERDIVGDLTAAVASRACTWASTTPAVTTGPSIPAPS